LSLPKRKPDPDAPQKLGPAEQCDPVPPDDADDIGTLLAGLDMEALAGTETYQEVIEKMTAEDLDWDESQTTDASRKVLTVADKVSRKVPANSNESASKKVFEEAVQPTSRKIRTAPRASDEKDKQLIDRIRETDSLPPIYSPAVSPAGSALISTPSISLHVSPSSDLINSKKSATIFPSWEKTRDRLKLTMYNRALGVNARSWSLNLSPDCIEEAQRGRFADVMKRRLETELEKALGYVPSFWFGVDTTRVGRLHLHGGIDAPNDLETTAEAFCVAGGEWAASRKDEHQFEWKEHCDDGWPKYALRDAGAVRKLIKGRPIAVNGLHAAGRKLYESLRTAKNARTKS
jgi:hypothetical protein